MNKQEQETIDNCLDRMNENKRELELIEREKKALEIKLKEQLKILRLEENPTQQDIESIAMIEEGLKG